MLIVPSVVVLVIKTICIHFNILLTLHVVLAHPCFTLSLSSSYFMFKSTMYKGIQKFIVWCFCLFFILEFVYLLFDIIIHENFHKTYILDEQKVLFK